MLGAHAGFWDRGEAQGGHRKPFAPGLQTVACKLLLATRLEKTATQSCWGNCFRGEYSNSGRLWGIIWLCYEMFLFFDQEKTWQQHPSNGPHPPKNKLFLHLLLNPTPSLTPHVFVFIFLLGRRARIKCS